MDDEEREEAGGRDEQPPVGKSKPVVVSTVEEGDDDDDETWMMVKSRAVAESGAETAWQIRRDKRVQFAAAAAQWHERQRRAEEFDLRTGKVCGKGYEGDEPVTVDENGTIIDSGTNIDVMSYKTAQLLHKCGLRYVKCQDGEPKRFIMFGIKSVRIPILGYMHGQGLLGKQVAVVQVLL